MKIDKYPSQKTNIIYTLEIVNVCKYRNYQMVFHAMSLLVKFVLFYNKLNSECYGRVIETFNGRKNNENLIIIQYLKKKSTFRWSLSIPQPSLIR